MTRPGFTLIELIVTISILLLLTGFFVAGYTGFSQNQAVAQSARIVQTNLQSARTQASSGEKPTGCDTLVGYTVAFPSASVYTVGALCAVGTVGAVQSYALPSGITFSPVPTNFMFLPLAQGATVGQTITLVGSATNQSSLEILTSGVVSAFVPTPTP